jgi:hypothetical protein
MRVEVDQCVYMGLIGWTTMKVVSWRMSRLGGPPPTASRKDPPVPRPFLAQGP